MKKITAENYEEEKFRLAEIERLRKLEKLKEIEQLSKCKNKENCGFWQWLFSLIKSKEKWKTK